MIAEKMKELVANSSAIRATCLKKETAWPESTERKMYMISALAIPMCRRRKR